MDAPQPTQPRLGLEPIVMTRLCWAMAQALLLALLMLAKDAKVWPATSPAAFAALYLPLLFVPLLISQGAGTIPGRRLVAWAALASALGAVMGAHALTRGLPRVGLGDAFFLLMPDLSVHAAYAAVLFIGQALIAASVIDQRRIASYRTYFETAWKQGVQVVAADGFTVVFWIVLALGAELFKLVQITFLAQLIQHAWFSFPATVLAFAAAIHVTDVRPQIVRSIKTLILTLLSWLLPVAAGIALVFLASLPFTGLAPLWATRFATAILLACSAGLIFLLNAAYQDGTPERAVAAPVRVMGTVTAILLLPMMAIAAYSVWLRIHEYGLTRARVIAVAEVLVAACYAVGYILAARRWTPWLKPLEVCNTTTSFVVIAVLVALFTPLADPARLAVNSQVARLQSGAVAPDKFDFMALRFDNGVYGEAAVLKLRDESEQAEVKAGATRALAALAKTTPPGPARSVDAAALAALIVNPSGARLPESFLKQDWASGGEEAQALAQCLHSPARPCTAVPLDLDGDGLPEVMVMDANRYGPVAVFRESEGRWTVAGHIQAAGVCSGVREALARGEAAAAPPLWRDITVDGRRLSLVPKNTPVRSNRRRGASLAAIVLRASIG